MVDLSKGGEPWASSLPTGFNYGDGAPDRARWEADARQPFRLECAPSFRCTSRLLDSGALAFFLPLPACAAATAALRFGASPLY